MVISHNSSGHEPLDHEPSNHDQAHTPLARRSILDLARVYDGESFAQALRRSVRLAKLAETQGFHRIWFAEHHNMRHVASSATSLVIQHIAQNTERIRVGAGGIMLTNHAPLVIAEQFGTLETFFPGRIDLGLGRAPGTDQNTMRALRRDGSEAQHFRDDVLELIGYFNGPSRIPSVSAIPGTDTQVPLYILGSSMYGAQLAASLGLPYAFASHFAPQLLHQAAHTYRREFNAGASPLGADAQPYFIAAANVIAHDDAETAHQQRRKAENGWIKNMLGRNQPISDDDAEALRDHPAGQQVLQMLTQTASGSAPEVNQWLDTFAADVQADELILVNLAPELAAQESTLCLLGPATQPTAELAGSGS